MMFNVLVCVFAVICAFVGAQASYNVGVGIYDTTGPAAEINFMGYASELPIQ
jgi:hypothetical protein